MENPLRHNCTDTWIINGKNGAGFSPYLLHPSHRNLQPHPSPASLPLTISVRHQVNTTKIYEAGGHNDLPE